MPQGREKRLIILVGSAVVLLVVIVILIIKTSKSPSVSADINNGATSDQLQIEGSLPALD